jgi:DNA-3-methyladenine glycosylase
VCEPSGSGAAVLLRALEPIEGAAGMRARRRLPRGAPDRDIGSGPGRLAQAMGISLADDGRSLLRGALSLRRAAPGDPPVEIATSRRVGLGRGRELRFRFYARGNPHVSR